MRRLLVLCFITSSVCLSQEGTQFGFKVNASWKLNTHRNKAVGLFSADNGYGFSFGVPVRFWRSESQSFDTGLEYEFTAFDALAGGQLQSSWRIQSLGVPLASNININNNWFWQWGGGVNFLLLSRQWNPGQVINIISQNNRFQPYIMLGINSLAKRDNHFFDFGIQARYFFLDLQKKGTPVYESFSSKLLAIDFTLKFYLSKES